jgi:hypothetical protein
MPSALPTSGAAGLSPALAFTVLGGAAEPHAAVPTLRFTLGVESRNGVPVRSVMLTVQLRIAVARRAYAAQEQSRLAELFGTPDRWRESARSLYWTHATVVVPPFERRSEVDVLVPCTYDFELAVPKYFHAIPDGEIPLDFLFSGSVFYADERDALRTTRIGWDSDATYQLPATVWREMMDHYFPHSAWLRLDRAVFDRLYAFRVEHALPSWEHALGALMDAAARGTEAR